MPHCTVPSILPAYTRWTFASSKPMEHTCGYIHAAYTAAHLPHLVTHCRTHWITPLFPVTPHSWVHGRPIHVDCDKRAAGCAFTYGSGATFTGLPLRTCPAHTPHAPHPTHATPPHARTPTTALAPHHTCPLRYPHSYGPRPHALDYPSSVWPIGSLYPWLRSPSLHIAVRVAGAHTPRTVPAGFRRGCGPAHTPVPFSRHAPRSLLLPHFALLPFCACAFTLTGMVVAAPLPTCPFVYSLPLPMLALFTPTSPHTFAAVPHTCLYTFVLALCDLDALHYLPTGLPLRICHTGVRRAFAADFPIRALHAVC